MGIITTFGQYQRVERLAGGVASSDRAFLRAARLLLSKDGKSRAKRELRRQWYEALLIHRTKARRIHSYAIN